MSSDGVSSSTDVRPVKQRLTFNWPTKSSSKSSVAENKLPVKQRVVFPNDRLKGNCDNGNSKRSHWDDDWDSMADAFRNPSPTPTNWDVGSDNERAKGKKRRNESWGRHNKDKNEPGGSGKGANWSVSSNWKVDRNDRDEFQRNRNPDSWESWELASSWETNTKQSDAVEQPQDNRITKEFDCSKFISTKSVETQTESTSPRSIAVQTDPKVSIAGHQETAYNHATDIITLSPTRNRDKESSRPLVIDLDPQLPGPSHRSPISTSVTEIVCRAVNRDPRIARNSKSFQSISPK